MTVNQLEQSVESLKKKRLVSDSFSITFVRLRNKNVEFAYGKEGLDVYMWDNNGHCFIDADTSVEIAYNNIGELETVEVLKFRPYPKLNFSIH